MKGQFGFVGTLHPTHRPAVRGSHLSIGARMLRWYQLYRQRRELAGLSDAMLKDLGLSRGDVMQESERPFWDDPLAK
ncbi:hypothetical protein TUM18999_23950 [Pseudomonas tohonis]|uniref:YjiS-like domain-containing protein n=1 Tax=Pseudomonas tohonis TaxID=2725477 RepID=A0A6J4E5F0_9PSED|nr:DUF1127 domain-containing protein [Pseudomonas tohonis]BCG24204.1 hypothetical protein TUM18999_23950 [Pseudomonas tohonis]GJN56405.1 hypothetical protein TUM20286_61570 [Pseudomonas tohonis]